MKTHTRVRGIVLPLDTAVGPLTVTWSWPELAKASEYHVRMADLGRNGDSVTLV